MNRVLSRVAIRTTSLVVLVTAFLFSLSVNPANAVSDGTVNCGTSGTFTIAGNVVTESDSCLGSVTIPSDVTSITNGAFSDAITSVSIPDTVLTIPSLAFINARSITEFTVDANNPNFSSPTSGLNSGVLFNKDGTTLIRFPGAKSNSYVIPNSVTTVGPYAFYALFSMTLITLPTGLTNISNGAFASMLAVTSLGEIPATVASIESGAFFELVSLEEFSVAANNPNYTSQDGVLFNKSKTVLMYYPSANTRTSYTIPNSVTSLGESALKNTSLIDLTIPASVTEVDGRNIYESSVLRTVTFLGNAPTTVGYNSFTSNSSAVASITQCATGFPGNGENYYSFTIQVTNSSSCDSSQVINPPVVKNTPQNPKVSTRLKVRKSSVIKLHSTLGTRSKGANSDGLSTVITVAKASKKICSATKVVKKKKITGYKIKGLKAGKCSVVVTITGNSSFESSTQTTVVNVRK